MNEEEYTFLLSHVIGTQSLYFASDRFSRYMDSWQKCLEVSNKDFSTTAANSVDQNVAANSKADKKLADAHPWYLALQTVTASLASVNGSTANSTDELSGLFAKAINDLFKDESPVGLVLFYQFANGIFSREAIENQIGGMIKIGHTGNLKTYLDLVSRAERSQMGKVWNNSQLDYLQRRLFPPDDLVPVQIPLTRKFSGWEKFCTVFGYFPKLNLRSGIWLGAALLMTLAVAYHFGMWWLASEARAFREKFVDGELTISKDEWSTILKEPAPQMTPELEANKVPDAANAAKE